MNWLQKLPIKKRLPVAFGLISLLLILTSIGGIFAVLSLSPIITAMYQDKLLPANDLNFVSRAWLSIRTANFSAIASEGGEAEKFRKADELYKELNERMDKYSKTKVSEQDKANLARYKEASERYWAERQRIVERVLAGAKQEALAIVDTEGKAYMTALTKVLDGMVDAEVKSSAQYNKVAQQEAVFLEISMITIAALAILLTIFFALKITRSIVVPLGGLEDAAQRVAAGDLNTSVEAHTKDELGNLALAFNGMVGAVRSGMDEVARKGAEAEAAAEEARQALEHITMLTDEVRSATDQVTQYTTEISSSVQQMAAATQEQAQQASEVAAASEEMAQTISETAQSITVTARSSAQASAAAKAGMTAVERAQESMRMIAEVTNETGDKIDALTVKVEEVGTISDTITEIADQTNLLALNAAIEAARAGTHGRGFAVVADEVRKLAERTAKATKDIAVVLKSIQQETRSAHESMARAGDVVVRELASSDELTQVFERISGETDQVTTLINQIAVASEEQSSTMADMSRTIEGMHVVAEQSAAGVHQIAQATTQLGELTENLRVLVETVASGQTGDSEQHKAEMQHLPDKNGVNRNGKPSPNGVSHSNSKVHPNGKVHTNGKVHPSGKVHTKSKAH